VIYQLWGQQDKALESYQEALKAQPDSQLVLGQMMGLYLTTMQLDEAQSILEKMFAQNKDSSDYHGLLTQLDFLRDDSAGLKREFDWLSNKPGVQATVFGGEANIAAYHGQFVKSQELSLRAFAAAGGANAPKDQLAAGQAGVSIRLAAIGESDQAKKMAQTALATPGISTFAQVTAAMTLGMTGDSARAQTLHDDISKRFPEDTILQNILLPSLQGMIEYGRGDFAKTVDAFQPVMPFELSSAANLDPAYIRGMAYLKLNKGAEAAAEFQKLIDHRGVVGTSITGPLAHLGLARARILQNDRAGARTEYQNFLALWKDADTDIPIFKHAQAEYAMLK
jgi:tetratricopeptide (TPR) repeat protein